MPSLTPAKLPGHLVERRDLLLPRGVWRLNVPVDDLRVFLLVTSTGAMILHRLPESLFADPDSEHAVLDALADSLERIDPQLRLVVDETKPAVSALAQRVMMELGYHRPATDDPTSDRST